MAYTKEDLRAEIALSLNVDALKLYLRDPDGFLTNERRILKGVVVHDGQDGFVKVAHSRRKNEVLREQVVDELAKLKGFRTSGIVTPYNETPSGFGVVELKKLANSQGRFVTHEQLNSEDPDLGRRAAYLFFGVSGISIPESFDSGYLYRGDWRVKSVETFWKVWEEQNGKVFDSQYYDVVDGLVGSNRLKYWVREAADQIGILFEEGEGLHGQEFFAHNDAAPNNIFFANDSGDDTLVDFQYASACPNFNLAILADLSNFTGRCWPNIPMQRAFLDEYYGLYYTGGIDSQWVKPMMRAAAVNGSMYLAKYAMEPASREHSMAQVLLKNLPETLIFYLRFRVRF